MGLIKKVIEKDMFFGAKAELFNLPPPPAWEGERRGEAVKPNQFLKLTARPPGECPALAGQVVPIPASSQTPVCYL